MKLLAALFCAAVGVTAETLIPAGVQAEKMRQAAGSAKVDDFGDITPACSAIGCADIQCLPPLQLQRREGQCCPICWAPDHVVGLDRHTAMEGGSPFKAKLAPAAPSDCKGAKCFTHICREGETLGHSPGRCCESCK